MCILCVGLCRMAEKCEFKNKQKVTNRWSTKNYTRENYHFYSSLIISGKSCSTNTEWAVPLMCNPHVVCNWLIVNFERRPAPSLVLFTILILSLTSLHSYLVITISDLLNGLCGGYTGIVLYNNLPSYLIRSTCICIHTVTLCLYRCPSTQSSEEVCHMHLPFC